MKRILSLFLVFVLLPVFWAEAQTNRSFSRRQTLERIRTDIYRLAADDMEGRESGTEGEVRAAHYIKERMQEIGLQPVFGTDYFQWFPIPGEWVWGEENNLVVAGHAFEHEIDFFSIPGSASTRMKAGYVYTGDATTASADPAHALALDKISGKYFVMEYHPPSPAEGEGRIGAREWIASLLQFAREGKAAGIVFVNTRPDRDDPRIDFRNMPGSIGFPMIFAYGHVFEYMMQHPGEYIDLSVNLYREELQSLNVAGYIDNGSATTVVIGGHFDHLGFGGRGSRTPGEQRIHPGADDNASGVAGVLEAARYIKDSDLKNHNYLFIAFGAEEKGLLGSRYFTTSGDYEMARINYMFNLDMIGRLEQNRLSLIGTGSSPSWDDLIERLAPSHLDIRKSPGGLGGSDHASFYMQNIPVLFFFTGTHHDYHMPGDTPDKINFDGLYDVYSLMMSMVRELDKAPRLVYSMAPVAETRRRSDAPSLGLMPDHAFEGDGLRIQAVIENRPAHRAGIQDGDVIMKINDTDVQEIQTYMEALNQLRSGTKARVVVLRGEEKLTIDVQL